MKRLILFAIVTASAFAAAIGPQTVWEVRLTNGLSANGGGFDIGAVNLATISGSTNAAPIVLTVSSTAGMTTGDLFCVAGHTVNTAANGCWVGTVIGSTISLAGTVGNGVGGAAGVVGDDRSQQNAAAFSGTSATTDGAGVLSSGTHNFVQADVGNFVNLQSCTGSLTSGIYEVVSVAANTATLNASPGVSLTACTWAEGGAIKLIHGTTNAAFTLAANMVTQNRAFVKAESGQTIAENQAFTAACAGLAAGTNANRITGYVTSRTETPSASNRAVITLGATSIFGFQLSNQGWILENVVIDCAGLSSTIGASFGSHSQVVNSRVTNCLTNSFSASGNLGLAVLSCEIDHNPGPLNMGQKGTLRGSYVHDNTATLVVDAQSGTGNTIEHNVFYNNTGATADTVGLTEGLIAYNDFYKCGRHCITLTNFLRSAVKGNIIVNGGTNASGCGLYYGSATPVGANFGFDGNAYYNNSGGNRCSVDDPNGIGSKQDAIVPYVNIQDVLMTGNPWTAPDSGDFSLNSAAGAGASVRATAPPVTLPIVSTTNRLDFGPFQHLDAGGAGGGQRSYTYAK